MFLPSSYPSWRRPVRRASRSASVLRERENAEKAEPEGLPGWLRTGRERPRHRGPAKKRDEFAPPDVEHWDFLRPIAAYRS